MQKKEIQKRKYKKHMENILMMKKGKQLVLGSFVITGMLLLLSSCAMQDSFEKSNLQTDESNYQTENQEVVQIENQEMDQIDREEADQSEAKQIEEIGKTSELIKKSTDDETSEEMMLGESDTIDEEKEKGSSFSVTKKKETLYAMNALNVRLGPGINYDRIGTLSINQKVEVTGVTENLWYEIAFNGQTGYCSGKYLSEEMVSVIDSQLETSEANAKADVLQEEEENASSTTVAPVSQTVVISNVEINDLLTAVNADRAANGLSLLTTTTGLQSTAALRAQECAVSFSHTRPDGSTCFTAFPDDGATSMAENIYMVSTSTTAAAVEAAWMNSEGHKENILNATYTKIGIGIYQAPNGYWYFVQDFSN
jgi:uncharacterized protein YkwD